MKILKWVGDNILFVLTLFLIAFIPLYPKLPLFDVKNTWVYIRADDVVVLLVIATWILLLLRRKISLRTPLTLPILLFWIVGAVATIHGILLIFPTLANVFPNVAFLSFLRRIEYISLFFVAYSGMRDRRYLSYVIGLLSVTLLCVVLYGIGQRYLGFPAYLTMNEEFAKGEPIRLSQLSRVPSTFAGHYDLAAYLVLIVPILTSLAFGVRNWLLKSYFFVLTVLGLVLMFMTVSRVSFFVLFISLGVVVLLHKKKLALVLAPVVAVFVLVLLSITPALQQRFGNTIKEVDVIVDAKTGNAIGEAKEVSSEYFKDKLIIKDSVLEEKVEGSEILQEDDLIFASSEALLSRASTTSAGFMPGVVPYYVLPKKVILLVPANASTGENLPQGTGYINLSLSPVKHKISEYYYEQPSNEKNSEVDVIAIGGNFLVKRAAAYDLSFTTRFQGEWPNAIRAFMRNVLFGSGYGSISLAVDNNYFRLLGEVGLLGTIAFLLIFITAGIYIYKVLPHVDSPMARSFIMGFVGGVIGVGLNAFLIDVFEASKVAYVLWLLTGVSLGILTLYSKKGFDTVTELRKALSSPYAVIFYLGLLILFLYSPMISNYFVGDDFTWFRWVHEDKNILNYFINANGFFYRPGAKLYFHAMYSLFWLNQAVYHSMSIILHFVVSALVFALSRKVLKNYSLSVLSAFLFVILSGYSESVFWISSTGYLFTAVFSLLSLLLFISWVEKKKTLYIIISIICLFAGMLYHELGVVTPFMMLLYMYISDESDRISSVKKKRYTLFLLSPLAIYAIVRFLANTHWFSGDYNYNVLRLPFNIIGNSLGYLLLSILGPISLSLYQTLRSAMREQIILSLLVLVLMSVLVYGAVRYFKPKIHKSELKTIIFSVAFFFIGLLPFLGLGNLSSRYSYLSSAGVAFLLAYGIGKIYQRIASQGRDIALGVTSVVVAFFILLQLMQVQQIHGDWHTAGEKAKRFLNAIDEVYNDYWAKEPMTFYFVNVPIKTGEAWIFPVGLKDALWFSFRNPDITINYSQSTSDALQRITNPRGEKVFEFDGGGGIIEHKKIVESR